MILFVASVIRNLEGHGQFHLDDFCPGKRVKQQTLYINITFARKNAKQLLLSLYPIIIQQRVR